MRAGLVLLALLGARPALAQIPDPLRSPDSLRADSIRADSVARAREFAERFVAERNKGDVRLAVVPLATPAGPVPAGGRIVFMRDSVEWMQAQTLGDLIAQVPGTYLWRGGWLGAPELPNFRARGAGSVEYLLDGLPYVALGRDSVAVDPILLPLSMFDRVEIEQWPALLRVHLVTRRSDRLAARSLIGLGRGTNSLTRFLAQLETRRRSGLVFSVLADYYNSGEVPDVSLDGDYYRNTALLVQLGYVPDARKGVVAQLLRNGPRRLSPSGSEDAPDAVDARRNDYLVRGFLRSRDDGLGRSADVFIGLSQWNGEDDDIRQSVGHVGASVGLKTPTSSLGATAAWRSRWTPLDVRATASWTPSARVAVRAEGAYQLHSESRSATWVGAQASAGLAGPLGVQGSVRAGSILLTPAIADAEPQTVLDVQGAVTWESRLLGAQAGLARTDAFLPTAFPTFQTDVATIAPVPGLTWLTVRGRVTPFNWLSVQGWYETPLGATPEGQPIDHLVGEAEFRSKFLRQFRSGVFDMRFSIGWERWGTGILGSSADGVPLQQVPQNFFRFRGQVAIQSFTVFFERYNLANQVTGYVPGRRMFGNSTIFGVRWGFMN
jgi:hypothetical protein